MANFFVPRSRPARSAGPAPGAGGQALSLSADGSVNLDRRVAVDRGPIGDLAAGSTAVVVASPVCATVTVLDPTSGLAGAGIAVPGEPVAVVAAEDRAYVATTSEGTDALSVIDLDAREVLAVHPVAFGITALAVSPDGKRVYAARTASDQVDVAVLDTVAERMGTIEVGYGPAATIDALSVDPTGKSLYAGVTDASGSRLVVIDTETAQVARVIAVGSPIRDIANAGGTVHVLTSDRAVGGAVHVIDLAAARITGTVELGGAPTQLVMSPDRARAYVVDYDHVAVVCTLTLEVVDSLSIGTRPSCVAVGADGCGLFIADYTGAVTVFSVESTIEMMYSQFLATDPIPLSVPRALQPAAV